MTKNEVLKDLLKFKDGVHLGDLVDWSIHGLVDQDKARDLAAELDLKDDFSFPKVTPNTAYRRAVRAAVRGGGKTDEKIWDVVKVEDSETHIVHAIVRRSIVDGAASVFSPKDAEYETVTKVGFSKEEYAAGGATANLFKSRDPDQEIAHKAREIYEDLCVVFRPEDIRTAFQRAFEDWGGIRLRERGGLWWVPSTGSEKIRAWTEYMSRLDNETLVFPIFDTSETVDSLRLLTEQNLEGQLAALNEELQNYSAKDSTRLSTLEKRVERFDVLRNKAELYERLLGNNLETLRGRLDVAQASLVSGLKQMS